MNLTLSQPLLQGKYGSTAQLHTLWMRYLWGPGANIAIILVLYTYRTWWTWVHGTFLALSSIATIALSLPILITTGIVYPDSDFPTNHNKQTLYSHYSIGITCMLLMIVVSAGGFVNRISFMTSLCPKTVRIIKWGHRLSGYALIILCKANYYLMLKPDHLDLIIIFDVVLGVFFLLRRFFFPKIGQWVISPKYNEELKQIKSVKELDQSKSYIVFANYVYRGENLKSNHPGGSKVINAITNKEVDRFLYGAYTADQLPETPRRAHSYKSISLLGKPIAQLQIPQTFSGFDKPEVECRIVHIGQVIKQTNIYQLWLAKKKGEAFQFNKYRDISQLGRYFTLTLNKKVTRLYSTVNFILEQNLKFLRKYSHLKQPFAYRRNLKSAESQMEVVDGSINNSSIEQQINNSLLSDPHLSDVNPNSMIPLMFRVYAQGKFTNGITTQPVKKLMIGCEKGQGLELAHTPSGHVIMVAGGTGQFAFSDLIDLIYKEQLVKERPECKEAAFQISPVLQKNQLSRFTFEIFLGARKIQDIHIITYQQLQYLAEKGRMKVNLRIDSAPQGDRKTEGINFTNESYEKLLGEAIDKGNISKVMISGPPIMNQILCSFLRKNYHRPDLYLLV